jgi:hypothetical protein
MKYEIFNMQKRDTPHGLKGRSRLFVSNKRRVLTISFSCSHFLGLINTKFIDFCQQGRFSSILVKSKNVIHVQFH